MTPDPKALADELERLHADVVRLSDECRNEPPSLGPWGELAAAQLKRISAVASNMPAILTALRAASTPAAAAAPEDLRPTLICRTCGLTAIVEPTKDPAP